MSNEIKNIIKIMLAIFVLAFVWGEAVAGVVTDRVKNVGGAMHFELGERIHLPMETMKVDVYVNGKKHYVPIVSIRECPHVVKVVILNNEGETKSEEELEADCE